MPRLQMLLTHLVDLVELVRRPRSLVSEKSLCLSEVDRVPLEKQDNQLRLSLTIFHNNSLTVFSYTHIGGLECRSLRLKLALATCWT